MGQQTPSIEYYDEDNDNEHEYDFIATQWKIFSNHLGISDDAYLSLIGSISAIFNGFGRILFGYIFDKTQSFRFVLGGINMCLAMLLFSWPYCFGNIMPFIWFIFFEFFNISNCHYFVVWHKKCWHQCWPH